MTDKVVSKLFSASEFFFTIGDTALKIFLLITITFSADGQLGIHNGLLLPLCILSFSVLYSLFQFFANLIIHKISTVKLLHLCKITNLLSIGIIYLVMLYNNYILLLLTAGLHGISSSCNDMISLVNDQKKYYPISFGKSFMKKEHFIALTLGILIISYFIQYIASENILDLPGIIITSMFIISYLLILFIPKSYKMKEIIKLSKDDYIRSMKKVFSHKTLYVSLLGVGLFWFLMTFLITYFPIIITHLYHAKKKLLLLFAGVMFLGMGTGRIFSRSIIRRREFTQFIPTAMLGVALSLSTISFFSTSFSTSFSIPIEQNILWGVRTFWSHSQGKWILISVFLGGFTAGIYYSSVTALLIQETKKRGINLLFCINLFTILSMALAALLSSLTIYINFIALEVIYILSICSFILSFIALISLPYTVIKNVFRSVARLFYRIKVIGLENYYKAGNKVLVISNHVSFLDPILISIYLPGKVVVGASEAVCNSKLISICFSLLGIEKINIRHDASAKELINAINQNKTVLLFPEGRMSVTASLMKIYDIPGFIINKTKAKLLPVYVGGIEYGIFAKNSAPRLLFLPKVIINFLEPKELYKATNQGTRTKTRENMADQLYDIMSEMMFVSRRNKDTIIELLLDAKKKAGGNFLIANDVANSKITYNKLLLHAFVIGSQIAKLVPFNKILGIILPNTCALFNTFIGTLLYGRKVSVLNYSIGVENVIQACKTAKIETIVTSSLFVERFDFNEAIKKLENEKIKIVYLEDIKQKTNIATKLSSLVKSFFPYLFYKWNIRSKWKKRGESGDIILFTSGSESIPKGVVLTHINIIANIQQILTRVDLNFTDRLFNTMPMFHSVGLCTAAILPICSGIYTYFYTSPLHYKIIPELIYKENITIVIGNNTFFLAYAKAAHPYDFFNIRYALAGAEKIREETINLWMKKFGIRILEAYGTTEASPVISCNTPMYNKIGSVGKLLPGIEYMLGKVQGISEGGRLIVKGKNIMAGYMKHDKPGVIRPYLYKKGKEVLKGWYDTGDIVSVDEKNFITIIGRVKRFCKIGGEMISLTTVEEIATKIWPEHIHAAIGKLSPRGGEEIILYTSCKKFSRQEFSQKIAEIGYTSIYTPRRIIYKKNIPILGSGKIDYVKLAR